MKWYGKIRKTRAGTFTLLAVTFIILFTADTLWRKAEPLIADIAESKAETMVTEILSGETALSDYNNIIKIRYSSNGNVTSVETDTNLLNAAKAQLCRQICEKLKNASLKVKVDLGDLTGSPLTLGNGIKLTIHLSSYSATVTDISTQFYSAGINQTLYRITAQTRVTFSVILPRLEKRVVTTDAEIPLCETLIVGEVPQYYNGK